MKTFAYKTIGKFKRKSVVGKLCSISIFLFSFVVLFAIVKNSSFSVESESNLVQSLNYEVNSDISMKYKIYENTMEHETIVNSYFKNRKKFNTSNLGDVLYKNKNYPNAKQKKFKILIWKSGSFLERRHISFFQPNSKHDPFEMCSVNNCKLTYEDEDLETSDAVVVHLHRLESFENLPDSDKRSTDQRWIFLTDESPHHTFLHSGNELPKYANVFNWSMSYRSESDVPVPYGRTVPLKMVQNPKIPTLEMIPNGNKKRKDVLVAIMVSNCGNRNVGRMKYLKELEKYIKIDVYGGCGTDLKRACPGHFSTDCPKLNDYMFYLAFENSNCQDYMTEKLFWNAYSKGAVPIIMGPSVKNCKTLLPPNSFIHVEEYARPEDLARYVILLNSTWYQTYVKLHEWRRHFEVVNEHGYFGSRSFHYCRICEALNYNDGGVKVYDNLLNFLDPGMNCEY